MNFLVVAQLFSILGSGLLAQPIVELMRSPSKAVWLPTSLNIGAAALNPTLSQAVDYWGRRWILIATTASGLVGAVIVSRAQNIATVLAGFCLIAFMFGGQAASFAVVGEILPRKYRALGQASLTVSQSVAGISGVLFCGALVQNGGAEDYRIYFYVVSGLFALATAAIAILYNPPLRELQTSLTHLEKLQSLDWIGILTFTTGAVLFSVGLAWSDNPYSWKDAHILSTFIVGLVLLMLFSLYEWRFKKDGIAHHGLFRDKNYIVALTSAFQEGIAVFTFNSYLAREGIVLFGLGFFQASSRYAMVYVYAIVLSFVSAWYITRFKALKGPLVLSQLALLLMFVLMATVKPTTSESVLWGYPLLGGLGLGCITTAIFVAAQLSITGELIAIGTGLVAAARALGGLVGLVVNNAIFNSAVQRHVPTGVAAAVSPLGLDPAQLGNFILALGTANPEAIAAIPGVTPEMIGAATQALRQAYSIAFRNVWVAAACFTVPGVIKAFNAHIDAPVEAKLVKLQADVENRTSDEQARPREEKQALHMPLTSPSKQVNS
ncbi:uncharacterized protein A1O9_09064 [Exophiala aquamarina CBS 119918]|uniref:Major facilitator superfamily (MFS) profile domain-containing protein n=1 Tax=Exophiala aquamarina CBS 119918 TaxID=1182545 RepID=A0A072P4I4_9EURO|nr:uncharacterized protein A1O9_09064 [Exophiala aquamarina CBS 119918]KEF54622.1 hypothetical protein A1O9_09064 [Exophiala aquamarina CBS 119918]